MTDNKFIERRRPPRREDLSVDDLTDLVKYIFATLALAIAELQHKLAELAATGKLDPQANMDLQFDWCVNVCEKLFFNTTSAVRRMHDTHDCDWIEHDNTYANGLQVMHYDPPQIAQDDWEFNEHMVDDGPIYDYRHHAVYHIAEPPFYADGRAHDRFNF